MRKQKGQVVLILILVMTVALAIGLSVIQRSLSDISTASKVEQSSRAFSAAEAGIEKAIQANSFIARFTLDNNAVIERVDKNDIPAAGQALEYLPLAKEEVAQVWLVNPDDDLTNPYGGDTLDVYWGDPDTTTDKPAIEMTVVYQDTSNTYRSKKYFYDQEASLRNNGFDNSVTCPPPGGIFTSLSPDIQKTFLCKKTINVSSSTLCDSPACLRKRILLRTRLLYNSTSQPFAVAPKTGFSLPVQAKLFTATGTSGTTQRKVRVFRLDKVVPSFFDYAIFSAGGINK